MSSPSDALSVRSRLVAQLRAEIADGNLKPGTRLSEKDVCDRYDVSRTAVREALRHLEVEGFLDVEPHRGAIISTISYSRVVDLFEIRMALEALAAELCATKATEVQKQALWRANENLESAFRSANVNTMIAAKDLFYSALLEGANNCELKDALSRLHTRISQLRRISLGNTGRRENSLAEIQAVVDAILAGDGSGASRAARSHVQRARAATLPRLFDNLSEQTGTDNQ